MKPKGAQIPPVPFFWKLLRSDQQIPSIEVDGETCGPDYVMVEVDGKTVQPDRGGEGAGPSGCHMHPGEGWDVLRSLYIPADGRPHSVRLQYRRGGHGGTMAVLPLSEPITVQPAGPRQAAGVEAPTALIQVPERFAQQHLDHAANAQALLVATTQSHTAQVQLLLQQTLQQHQAHTAQLMAAQQAFYQAVLSGQAGQVEAHREALAQTRATTDKLISAIEEGSIGGGGGLLPQLVELAPVVLPMVKAAGAWALEKVGGIDGIKALVGGVTGGALAAADKKADVLMFAVDRLAQVLENGKRPANDDDDDDGQHALPEPEAV